MDFEDRVLAFIALEVQAEASHCLPGDFQRQRNVTRQQLR